jgi:hypothetical protein
MIASAGLGESDIQGIYQLLTKFERSILVEMRAYEEQDDFPETHPLTVHSSCSL